MPFVRLFLSSMNTSPTALSVLQNTFGYPDFRGEQAQIVEQVINGGDALVLMPTGAGKSLCYQIPALVREGVGVVVSPLIALMQDQVDTLKELGVRAAFLNSTQSYEEEAAVEAALRRGELDLLYVAPERLLMPRCLGLLQSCKIALFAIDEAHCVSQWGHDFRPEYIKLSVLHELFPNVPRIALTATADAQTREEMVLRLQFENARKFVSSFDRPNIRYTIVEKTNARLQLINFIKANHADEVGIVYCLSRNKVEETADFLVKNGFDALPYHAGLPLEVRQANQARFLREDNIIMVATIAFGMGIDKPNVRFVAHLDLPKSMEGYYQETGRAGRDGEPSNAWMAYGLQDVVQQRRMISESDGSDDFKRVQNSKLDAMLNLCETLTCRRVHLLRYFDQTSEACGNCDTCLNPPQSIDGTEQVQKLLSCVYRVGQQFATGHVIDVLRGNTTERIEQFRHTDLSTFGIGKDTSEAEWRAVIRQAIAQNLLFIDFDLYNALKLSDAARPVLKGETSIRLRQYSKPAKQKISKASSANIGDANLSDLEKSIFNALRSWRFDTAKNHNVPAYVIFHDATLREIALEKPMHVSDLRGLSGIGDKKLDNYGAAIVEVVTQFI
ncbi:DNA helicase RecQ [Formosimonas limnophila]|nr:DNA helicase RecQ [Formosimonas limnophila]